MQPPHKSGEEHQQRRSNGLNAAVGAVAGSKATSAELANNSALDPDVLSFLNSHDSYNSSKPKAFLNWILFDEQFNYVASGSGIDQVGEDGQLKHHVINGIPVTKNGYFYVYVSNESPMDVFFDNLQVTHVRGPILEETHYYPFGLAMAGISSRATGGIQNRLKYNGKEEQREEFSDGSGLEWTDYGARMYDAQIGRWHSVDPSTEKYYGWTPYNYTFNNPLNLVDPDGRDAIVTVDKENKTITIKAKIYITGSGASKDKADELNQSAKSTYTKGKYKDGDVKYTVNFDVTYEYVSDAPKKLAAEENLLTFFDNKDLKNLSDEMKISKVQGFIKNKDENNVIVTTGNKGYILGDDIYDNNVILHESGHLLGLSDRYIEKGTQWVNGIQQRVTDPHTGFENDLMGNPRKSTSLSNVHYSNYGTFAMKNASTAPYTITGRVDVDNKGDLIGGSQKASVIIK